MAFETFKQKHDPNGREEWTWQFKLAVGASIASAAVDVVNKASSDVDTDTDIVLEAVAFGQISGQLWGVTVWISGGSPGNYFLRCHGEDDASPISRKFDKTMKLVCAQT